MANILIADSGSTKTSWCIIPSHADRSNATEMADYKIITTRGINPYQMSVEEICSVLRMELLPYTINEDIDYVRFYGAGCTMEKSPGVATALRQVIANDAKKIDVNSDMLGAAIALCGNMPGIIGILGTGANSCYYDGVKITENIPPLGYILGDEGSGAYIGKRLIGDVLKKQLPENICKAFFEETRETAATIIQKTYREPLPNRFLASMSMFCARHKEDESIQNLLTDSFDQFFKRNINTYKHEGPIHLVGSIAYYYKEEVTKAASFNNKSIGNIIQAPIHGLIRQQFSMN